MTYPYKTAILILALLALASKSEIARADWDKDEIARLPIKTSNNAVCYATVNDTLFLYSFGGMDSTKKWDGIHQKSFRYNTISKTWHRIPDMPDSLGGVIAAGASQVDGKIYIMGGYHVYENGREVSSYENRIYDPQTNSYSRGANIPVPIDDHVQVVYKHFIYLISGWTHTIGGGNNTNAVQIYDTKNDTWLSGTPTPNTTAYKVFGANGIVHGDTIFYIGGARYGNNFPLSPFLRMGVIDPGEPTKIAWTMVQTPDFYKPYRGTSFFSSVDGKDQLVFLGGSDKSYNYNGLAYDGSGGAKPLRQICFYDLKSSSLRLESTKQEIPMDLRGNIPLSPSSIYLIGGMDSMQEVGNSVIKLTYKSPTNVVERVLPHLHDYSFDNEILNIHEDYVQRIEIFDFKGRLLRENDTNSVSIKGLKPGTYVVRLYIAPDLYSSFKLAF